jgi:hypothetical protein
MPKFQLRKFQTQVALGVLALTIASIAIAPTSAQAVTTCANGGTCTVGDTGPGGGIVFYVSPNTFGCGADLSSTCKYLEVDLPITNSQNLGTLDSITKWANTANLTTAIGAAARNAAIGTGYKNTVAIINQNGAFNMSTNRYEAGLAQADTLGGKTDWYMPSRDELTVLSEFLTNWNQIVVPSMFINSSTESSASSVWGLWRPATLGDPGGAAISNPTKNDNNFVTPIRAFAAGDTGTVQAWVYSGPSITGFSVRTAEIAGGSQITVTGGNFQDVTSATLGGTALTLKSKTSSQLVFEAPAHAAGLVYLVLKAPTAIYTFQDAIEYKDASAPAAATISTELSIEKSITSSHRQTIVNLAKSATTASTLTCTATYNKTAGPSDAKTAKALALAACTMAKQTNPLITTKVIGLISNASSQRKVLLELTH